eukprot:symbB.v1.2.020204.t1/scaffold1689.1/size105734/2
MKKAWCCAKSKKGCEKHFACDHHDELQWSAEEKEYCCAAGHCRSESFFDCKIGFDHWKLLWTSAKKDWCCSSYGRGCTSSDAFDCSQEVEAHTWSESRVMWCCQHRRVGCGTKRSFDCMAGYGNWKEGWSSKKKVYCCNKLQIGCDGHFENLEVIPISETDDYDCTAGFSNWKSGWSDDKKGFCCGKYELGCPPGWSKQAKLHFGKHWSSDWSHASHHVWAAKEFHSSPGGDHFESGYDCITDFEHWRVSWSSNRARFCCQKYSAIRVTCRTYCSKGSAKSSLPALQAFAFGSREDLQQLALPFLCGSLPRSVKAMARSNNSFERVFARDAESKRQGKPPSVHELFSMTMRDELPTSQFAEALQALHGIQLTPGAAWMPKGGKLESAHWHTSYDFQSKDTMEQFGQFSARKYANPLDSADARTEWLQHLQLQLGGVFTWATDESEEGFCINNERFIISGLLGDGSFGSVYRCSCEGHQMAVKILSTERIAMMTNCSQDIVLRRMLQEPEILGCLGGHPNIVQLRCAAVSQETLRIYIVMQLLECSDLFTEMLRRRQPFNERDAREAVSQLVMAVVHCHRRGVAHRDIKLENVMVASLKPFVIKLIDFGQAIIHDQRTQHMQSVAKTLTTTSVYTPPEVKAKTAEDLSYDAFKLDSFAVGVVLYALLISAWPQTKPEGESVVGSGDSTASSTHAFEKHPKFMGLTNPAQDLIRGLLEPDPLKRLSVADALQHPWLCQKSSASRSNKSPTPMDSEYEMQVLLSAQTLNKALQRERGSSCWLMSGHAEAEDPCIWFRKSTDESFEHFEEQLSNLQRTAVVDIAPQILRLREFTARLRGCCNARRNVPDAFQENYDEVGSIDEMMKANVGGVLMPHGLGHFMGIDTHDVGGYPKGSQRDARDGFKALRVQRLLEPGFVLTVEPGVYFMDYALKKAKEDPELRNFFNWDRLADFRHFGGIRLEDNVLVTENGIENFTVAPRTVEEVEAVMRGEIADSVALVAWREEREEQGQLEEEYA